MRGPARTLNAHWQSGRRLRHVILRWRQPCCSLEYSCRLKVRSRDRVTSSSVGVSLAEATLRAEHPDLASLLRLHAKPVQDLGDLTRARALLERAVSISEASLGSEHPLTADCLNDLAGTLLLQSEYVAARPLYERALTIYDRRLGPDNLAAATVLYNLAILHTNLGDFSRARDLHTRAVTSWQRVLGPEHPIVGRASWEFGQTLAEQGLHREAQQLFERALAIRERRLDRDPTASPKHSLPSRTVSYSWASVAVPWSSLNGRWQSGDIQGPGNGGRVSRVAAGSRSGPFRQWRPRGGDPRL